ncbi:MAG TPA: hypothetical protein VG223_07145 [Solirubrobacteraceae bacterium]|jgi:hypothetical protein|nr:hypothetical protein [Solirubrobacteraceae bacterium]
MSSASEIQQLEAEVRYYRERIALLRAKQYGRGLGSASRLQEYERRLASAELRLREHGPT